MIWGWVHGLCRLIFGIEGVGQEIGVVCTCVFLCLYLTLFFWGELGHSDDVFLDTVWAGYLGW